MALVREREERPKMLEDVQTSFERRPIPRGELRPQRLPELPPSAPRSRSRARCSGAALAARASRDPRRGGTPGRARASSSLPRRPHRRPPRRLPRERSRSGRRVAASPTPPRRSRTPPPPQYAERRRQLERLGLDASAWTTSETFDNGQALFTAVCELGFEGVVAKNHSSLYGPNDRGWVKVKNPNYWRRDAELEAMRHSAERRSRRGPTNRSTSSASS
jgi:hypothetical protein